eukprot:jgi/Botrbrau1/17155/Bobra.0157s0049.1
MLCAMCSVSYAGVCAQCRQYVVCNKNSVWRGSSTRRFAFLLCRLWCTQTPVMLSPDPVHCVIILLPCKSRASPLGVHCMAVQHCTTDTALYSSLSYLCDSPAAPNWSTVYLVASIVQLFASIVQQYTSCVTRWPEVTP